MQSKVYYLEKSDSLQIKECYIDSESQLPLCLVQAANQSKNYSDMHFIVKNRLEDQQAKLVNALRLLHIDMYELAMQYNIKER